MSLMKVGIAGLGGFLGAFALLFIVPSIVIHDEKVLDIYIFSVMFVIFGLPLLLIFYFSFIAYKNNKPEYIDGKYIWKDGRVYEGDWDKKHGASGKGKLTWSDGSYYEGEFKNGHLFGKGKRVCPSGESYEGDWENDKGNGKGKLIMSDGSCYEGEFKDGKPHGKGKREANGMVLEGTRVDGFLEGKGKLIGHDGGIYEGEFKKGKPDGMGIIKMINGYYYEGELKEGKRVGKFKKEILPSGTVIEGEFVNNGDGRYDGYGKITYSDGSMVEEGMFCNGKLNGEGKIYLKNGEYLSGNWINGESSGLLMYHFKDGSYYEGDYKHGWQGIGTYVAKNGDEYSTEFPYEVMGIFKYGFDSKMKEIQRSLNYIPKNEKEKAEERDRYLEISEKGTPIQKEIAKILLDFSVEGDKFLKSIRNDRSTNNYISAFSNMNNFYINLRKICKKLSNKHYIKSSSKRLYSYGEFFSKLDSFFDGEIKLGNLMVKIYRFLNAEQVLDFIVKKEQKDKEWVGLINDFSNLYKEDIQSELDWREYEKKFWEHNFKPDKKIK